jgi:hypothetical protein
MLGITATSLARVAGLPDRPDADETTSHWQSGRNIHATTTILGLIRQFTSEVL